MSEPSAGRPTTRPASDADDGFLRDLFAATRPEFGHLPADVAGALVGHQYEIRAAQYRARFLNACDEIVEVADRPIGRLLTDRRVDGNGAMTVIVDVAIHPDLQGQGYGATVLRAVVEHAAERGDDVELTVARDNPARRLYERLGFRLVTGLDDDVYCLLRRPRAGQEVQ